MKPLDDPQLRAKLIKASSDMPHVDVWAKIQAEAGSISQAAQARTPRTRFSIFSGLQLLAPAFVVLLVFGATLLSLTDEPTGQTRRTTTVLPIESVTVALPAISAAVPADGEASQVSNVAYDRLMARYAERLEATEPNPREMDSRDTSGRSTSPIATSARIETRDDMRAEWREYVEHRPHGRDTTLHLIHPFLSTMTPQ